MEHAEPAQAPGDVGFDGALRSAEHDVPECLSFDAVVGWVNEQPPAHEAAADDVALAICADLYV